MNRGASNNESGSDLRRLNSLVHSDDDESVLAHFGVRGMRWGVRKAEDGGSGSSGGSGGSGGSGKKKGVDAEWADATKDMSTGKKFAIGMALGPYWGAKYIRKQQKDAADPVKAMKKEKKELSNKIVKDFDKEMADQNVADKTIKEFKTKYGKGMLRWDDKQAEEFSNTLTERTTTVLKSVSDKHLAGTNYKITQVDGFNDFLPDFQLTQISDLEHSAIQHANANERSWILETEFDDENYVTGFKFPANFFEVDEDDISALTEEDEERDNEDE